MSCTARSTRSDSFARITPSSVPASGICSSVVFFFNSVTSGNQLHLQQICDARGQLLTQLSDFVLRQRTIECLIPHTERGLDGVVFALRQEAVAQTDFM